MPYKVFEKDEEYCVYKLDGDGNPTGDPLGCHDSEEKAESQVQALYANDEHAEMKEEHKSADIDANIDATKACKDCQDNPAVSVSQLEEVAMKLKLATVKAIHEGEDEIRIGGYAVVWGDEDNLDLHGEFFTPDTEEYTTVFKAMGGLPFMVEHLTDERIFKSTVVGIVDTMKYEEDGLWWEAKIKEHELYMQYVKPLVDREKLFTSSGTFPGAKKSNKATGQILRWPIAEITGTVKPAEYRMISHPISELDGHFKSAGFDSFEVWYQEESGETKNAYDAEQEGIEKMRKTLSAQLALDKIRLDLDEI